jgi:hypothetical protein
MHKKFEQKVMATWVDLSVRERNMSTVLVYEKWVTIFLRAGGLFVMPQEPKQLS